MASVQQVSNTSTATLPQISKASTSYDAIPYASYPVPASHPDRLYNVAKLFGMNPVPPERARVLELGCAGGGNLLPIASQFPGSSCLGIELSEVQCNDANIAIRFVGLKNIEVRQGSISDIRPSLGKFDYIICHGVFSWVPDPVREDILRVSCENLSENGVAYVSYNTLPGWYLRGMVRGMMMQHVSGIKDSVAKIVQARALLRFLVESTSTHDTPYAAYLKAEAEFLDKLPDHYLFHEHLEEHNKAFFFQEFARQAFQQGLQFLGESTLPSMWIGNLSAGAVKTLETIDDSVLRGHYTDCIVGRTFRETLLVRREASIDRNLNASRLHGIRFLGRFTEVEADKADAATSRPGKKRYTTQSGVTLSAERPSQIAIETLTKNYPTSLSIPELCEAIETGTQTEAVPSRLEPIQLATVLMQWALAGYIEFRFLPDRMRVRDYSRPRMSSWARSQARAGQLVTNLRHEGIALTEVHRFVVPLLDGTRDMESVAREVELLTKSGVFQLESENKEISWHSKETPRIIAQQLVAQIAEKSLILADS
ncbi:MAG: class I SAM-dependent methyltransferase [Pirellula sp.]